MFSRIQQRPACLLSEEETTGIVLLIPKGDDPRQYFVRSLEKFSDDFFDFERNQCTFETREPLE